MTSSSSTFVVKDGPRRIVRSGRRWAFARLDTSTITSLRWNTKATSSLCAARGIRLTDSQTSGLRVIGSIAAGVPLDYYPDTEVETLDLGEHVTGRVYGLIVKGDSMIDDHIASGDFVLIDPNVQNPEDGDIVVATHVDAVTDGGAATLKRFYREAERIRLQPANSTMEPIFIDAEEWDSEWKTQGRVIAVYRRC